MRSSASSAPTTPCSTSPSLEEIALADDYFVERRLYPNVDFYTGLIYKAMGFPTRMFTVPVLWAACPAGSPSGAR